MTLDLCATRRWTNIFNFIEAHLGTLIHKTLFTLSSLAYPNIRYPLGAQLDKKNMQAKGFQKFSGDLLI